MKIGDQRQDGRNDNIEAKVEYENALSISTNMREQMFTIQLEEEGNYKNWNVKINGPANTPYAGMIIEVRVTV